MGGPIAIQTQLQHEGSHNSHKGHFWITYDQGVIREIAPLSLTGHLLCMAIILRLGDIADPPNTQKQTQRGRQNGETKKYAPNERPGEFPRKIAK